MSRMRAVFAALIVITPNALGLWSLYGGTQAAPFSDLGLLMIMIGPVLYRLAAPPSLRRTCVAVGVAVQLFIFANWIKIQYAALELEKSPSDHAVAQMGNGFASCAQGALMWGLPMYALYAILLGAFVLRR